MKTTPEEFQALLEAPEGQNLEFKAAREKFSFDRLGEYCVALANEGGGKVLLGVTDKRPRQVVGTMAFPEPGETEAGLYAMLSHRIPVKEYFHRGTRVLIVHVPGRGLGSPWNFKGKFLKREGDSVVPMTDTDIRNIHAEEDPPDFSARACDAELDDLSQEAISAFQQGWAEKSNSTLIANLSTPQLLRDAELIIGDKITFAALILFGTREALGRYLPHCETIFEYRSSQKPGPAQERQEYREGFFLYFDKLWENVDKRNDLQSYQDRFFRHDVKTFDETSVREAVLNAVSHRDYRQEGSVFVRQYQRHVKIDSPGGFPSGITPENAIDKCKPRNRRLAESFSKAGLVERAGQGMDLMVEASVRQGKPLPDFSRSDEYSVCLTFNGTLQNPALVLFMKRLESDLSQRFTPHDFLTVHALANEQPLSEKMKDRIPALMRDGIVEHQGRGRGTRYYLSRKTYSAIGLPGTYTQRRGLDKETNKALLMRHLKDCGEMGAPMSELMQVLPSLSRNQVVSLLRSLRDDGLAFLEGERRTARWFATDSSSQDS